MFKQLTFGFKSQIDTIKDHITKENKTTTMSITTKIDHLPTGSMDMDKVKTTFTDVLKTTSPDYFKQQEEIVRATAQRIDINLADQAKRASNIFLNNIPEEPTTNKTDVAKAVIDVSNEHIVNFLDWTPSRIRHEL